MLRGFFQYGKPLEIKKKKLFNTYIIVYSQETY
jgi:hypothetical protein